MNLLKKIIEKLKDIIEYYKWYFGFCPMIAYQVSSKEWLKTEEVKLDKKFYLTNTGRKLRDAIYFIALDYNPDKWNKNSILCVRPDYDRLRKGDYVVMENDKEQIKICKVKCAGYPSLPDLFEDGEMPGITHDIIGKIVDVI